MAAADLWSCESLCHSVFGKNANLKKDSRRFEQSCKKIASSPKFLHLIWDWFRTQENVVLDESLIKQYRFYFILSKYTWGLLPLHCRIAQFMEIAGKGTDDLFLKNFLEICTSLACLKAQLDFPEPTWSSLMLSSLISMLEAFNAPLSLSIMDVTHIIISRNAVRTCSKSLESFSFLSLSAPPLYMSESQKAAYHSIGTSIIYPKCLSFAFLNKDYHSTNKSLCSQRYMFLKSTEQKRLLELSKKIKNEIPLVSSPEHFFCESVLVLDLFAHFFVLQLFERETVSLNSEPEIHLPFSCTHNLTAKQIKSIQTISQYASEQSQFDKFSFAMHEILSSSLSHFSSGIENSLCPNLFALICPQLDTIQMDDLFDEEISFPVHERFQYPNLLQTETVSFTTLQCDNPPVQSELLSSSFSSKKAFPTESYLTTSSSFSFPDPVTTSFSFPDFSLITTSSSFLQTDLNSDEKKKVKQIKLPSPSESQDHEKENKIESHSKSQEKEMKIELESQDERKKENPPAPEKKTPAPKRDWFDAESKFYQQDEKKHTFFISVPREGETGCAKLSNLLTAQHASHNLKMTKQDHHQFLSLFCLYEFPHRLKNMDPASWIEDRSEILFHFFQLLNAESTHFKWFANDLFWIFAKYHFEEAITHILQNIIIIFKHVDLEITHRSLHELFTTLKNRSTAIKTFAIQMITWHHQDSFATFLASILENILFVDFSEPLKLNKTTICDIVLTALTILFSTSYKLFLHIIVLNLKIFSMKSYDFSKMRFVSRKSTSPQPTTQSLPPFVGSKDLRNYFQLLQNQSHFKSELLTDSVEFLVSAIKIYHIILIFDKIKSLPLQ